MISPTKLSAKAANSLREKRRGISQEQDETASSGGAAAAADGDGDDCGGVEVSDMAEPSSNASGGGGSGGRSNVYSFFDPAEIRRPPTSPVTANGVGSPPSGGRAASRQQQAQPQDESDAASRGSHGSAATERIGNHRPPAGVSVRTTSAGSSAVRPSSSAWIVDETREVKYEEGATELFMLVEDAKWEEVCDR